MERTAEDVRLEVEGNIAIVTLNRPAKRNALSLAMWRRIAAVFADMRGRSEIRAAILTGAEGHFCAGADISEFATVRADADAGRIYQAAAEAAMTAVRNFPRPTLAAVSGYAMGGGCGLALACDFRVGDATTRMGIPAARLGLVYSTLECSLLHRQVGLATAKRVLFSGTAFALDECVAMGLVDVVGATALEGARRMAAEFAARAPLSVEGAKLVLEALAAGSAESQEAAIQGLIDRAMESADYREGGRAFLEKRQPVFVGR